MIKFQKKTNLSCHLFSVLLITTMMHAILHPFFTQIEDFSNIKNCIFTQLRIILGDFDFAVSVA